MLNLTVNGSKHLTDSFYPNIKVSFLNIVTSFEPLYEKVIKL